MALRSSDAMKMAPYKLTINNNIIIIITNNITDIITLTIRMLWKNMYFIFEFVK